MNQNSRYLYLTGKMEGMNEHKFYIKISKKLTLYIGKMLTVDGTMNTQANGSKKITCSMNAIVKNEYLLK